MSKKITIILEVNDDIDEDNIHEMLCTSIHDGDYMLMDRLKVGDVIDIQLVTKDKETNHD